MSSSLPPAPESRLESFDYELPPELIAQRPAARRDESRLMVLNGAEPPAHRRFRDLPEFLRPGDLLIRNDTKVLPARLIGRRPGGGRQEILLVRRLETPDALASETWLCLARPAGHLKPGKEIVFGDGRLIVTAGEKLGQGQVRVSFPLAGEELLAKLEELGEMPLPPYIEREFGPDAEDRERYQTTFAREAGAVAAPTAGLHFTPEVDAALAARGVQVAALTLHVGPGTFRPIKTDNLDEHAMDAEFYRLPPATVEAIAAARRQGGRIVAVGTTATRALEAAAGPAGEIAAGSAWTEIFIRPGYRFRCVQGLITNFHLPRSSLLVLLSALAGRERVLTAYREAVRERYRFYSYGDAMLVWP